MPPPRLQIYTDRSLLDASCYPHIIDGIFAQSTLSSLLVLRTVCKFFQKKADQRIAFHLILRGNRLPIEIHSGLLGERISTVNVFNFGLSVRERFPWVEKASVIDIDIDMSTDYKELSLLLLAWELKQLKTIRFPRGTPQLLRDNLGLPRAERTVYFSADIVPNPDPLTFLRHSMFYTGTVVINKASPSTAPTASQRYPLSPFCWASCLVVILHKWDTPVTPPTLVQGSIRAALEGNLGEAFHVLSAAAKNGLPGVIVVGLEQLSPGSLGLQPGDLGGKSIQDGLRSLLQEVWDRKRKREREAMEKYRAVTGSTTATSYLSSKPFKFLTLTVEDYKNVVGEAEYRIETSEEVRFARQEYVGKPHERFFPSSFLL